MARKPARRPKACAHADDEGAGNAADDTPEVKPEETAEPKEVEPAGPAPLAGDAVADCLSKLWNDESEESNWRRRLLSPFEVHFSQAHIRPEFQDGRTVDDTIAEIQGELCSPLDTEAYPGVITKGDSWWLLKTPFPEIEVIQWRCKLRAEDGSMKVDASGNELYGEREWYSLDNRRLYSLQKAAAKLYPKEVRCAVRVIRQEDSNYREFRKFRTPDLGRTVGIGHREAVEMPRWSWRREVGLPDEPLPVGVAVVKPARKKRNGHNSSERQGGDEDEGKRDLSTNALLFVLVYAVLRLSFHASKKFLSSAEAGTS